MLLQEIEIDSEFKGLVDYVKWLTGISTDDGDIELLLSCRRDDEGEMKRLIDDLAERGFCIPPMLVTTAIIAPELIKFKEKRNHWVLKTDYKMASLLGVNKENYLSDKIFNHHVIVDSILMSDGNDMVGYKARFTRDELSEILESHNSELSIEDFMVYEGENNEN